MNNYEDKEFKEIYSEVVENVKTLTSKWDPSISDESDPGVVILKAFALFLDKVNYKINYRNAQNSVKDATDPVEAKKLFYDLGYQMKRKRSATGNLSIRYIGSEDRATLNLFTQFSNSTGSQNYTSVRTTNIINKLGTVLVKVQEGVPSRYTYEGVSIFSVDDLTTNLRLSLEEVGEVSENGIVICSQQYIKDGYVQTSDWLNVEDSIFTAVETDNIFSIGHTSEGKAYIQFYEESLPALKNGIGIWIISSSGSAGNVPKNTVNQIISELGENISAEDFVISHEEFSNGLDEESISSAANNYYDTFGINNSLISERDYSISIPKILKTDLSKLASKALVTGVDGYHNLSEIVSLVNNGKDRVILVKLFETFLSHIFVNVLKSSKNYYESFEKLVDSETENLIKKAFYKDSVVSNKVVLTGNNKGENIYDEYIFDLASIGGTIVINSDEELNTIKNNIVLAIYKSFTSENLSEGEMLGEEQISKAVEESLEGIISASFYYDSHKLVKNIQSDSLTESKVLKGYSGSIQPTGEELSETEKKDILARSILRGDVKLFSEKEIQVPPGVNSTTLKEYKPTDDSGKIIEIRSSFNTTATKGGTQSLKKNEFIQFYTKSKSEDKAFGFGISYILQVDQFKTDRDLALSANKESKLLAGSIISAGSKIGSPDDETLSLLNEYIEKSTNGYEFTQDYEVKDSFIFRGDGNILAPNTVIYDGSTIYPNQVSDSMIWVTEYLDSDNRFYKVTLKNDIEYNLEELGVKLRVQTGDDSSTVTEYGLDSEIKHIKISGFSNGLRSSGKIDGNVIPNTYILAQEQITTLTDQKTVLLAKNYLYILVLNGNKTSLTIGGNSSYLLNEGEHLIYGDKTLVDFVDFGSGTLIHNPTNSSITLSAINSYDENITNKLVSLDFEIQIFNTQIISYLEGASVTGYEGMAISNEWIKVEDGSKIIINSDTEYGPDYFYRSGLIISTGANRVFNLSAGQSLEIVYKNQTQTIEAINSDIWVSCSQSININTAEVGFIDFENLSFNSYSLNITDGGAFDGQIEADSKISNYYTSNSFSMKAIANSTEMGYLKFPLGGKSYLLKISIDSDSDVEFNILKSEDGTSVTDKSLKILNGVEGNIVKRGKYQLYIYNSEFENCDFEIKILNPVSGVGHKDSIEIESFIELDGFNSDELNYSDLNGVYEKVNSLIDDGKVPFDFFYEPESPLTNPLDVLSFYDSRHLMNRNILTVVDLKYLWNNLRIIRRKK